MGTFSDYDLSLQEIHSSMAEAPESTRVEYGVDSILRELNALPVADRMKAIIFALDDLCAIANETPKLIDRYAAGQIITRAQLVGSFLLAASPNNKIVYLGR